MQTILNENKGNASKTVTIHILFTLFQFIHPRPILQSELI